MFDIGYLDISGSMGLAASSTLTLNMIFGMFLGTNFKHTIYWKKLPYWVKKYPIINYHNFTAYTAICFVVLHLLFLFLHKESGFSIVQLINPLGAPIQRNIVLLGVMAFYGFLLAIISSQKIIRKSMSFRSWKNIHLVAYATTGLFLVHGLLMDPLLKNRPTDWLDAEKFFSEGLIVIFIIAVTIRVRYQINQKKKVIKTSVDY